MGLQHRQVQYMDFSPSIEQKEVVDITIDKIQDNLPEDASVHSVLKYKGKGFEGNLKFSTKLGHFIAHARAKNMVQLLKKLRSKIMKQWKHKKTSIMARKVDRTLNVVTDR